MGSVKQGIRIKRAKNKNAKFKITNLKYIYTNIFKTNSGETKKHKYIVRKKVVGNKKYKYIYKYG